MPKKPELVPSEILPMYHYKAAFNFIFVQIQCFTDYFSPPQWIIYLQYFKIISGAWDIQPPFSHPGTAE